MRNIAIDVRMAQHTGIGRYIRGIVPALQNRSLPWQYTLIGKDASRKDFPPGLPFVAANVPIYSLSEQFTLPKLARFADCLHVPHYNVPILWKRKLVVTVHDLIHLHFPDHLSSPLARLYARAMLPLVVRRADAIIAVSEYTKKDLVDTLNIQSDKITVIHHGIDPSFLVPEEKSENLSEKRERYFLYVGLIKTHKNVGVLLEAFCRLKKKLNFPGLRLCLIGTPDHTQAAARKWLDRINREPDISLISDVKEDRLRELYRHATALVFPSLYEGFGFPLLEAMASRIPIIASRAASIPEILGETGGLYFDPLSASELANCMTRILESGDLRNRLIGEGLKRLTLFNWKTAGQKTEKVYESVLSSN